MLNLSVCNICAFAAATAATVDYYLLLLLLLFKVMHIYPFFQYPIYMQPFTHMGISQGGANIYP